ncbi:Uncharacterized protein PECH_000900 [Penicillium ucsense]|uniref:Amidohydrolase-related domain-containing protein n=1 Tax=Penicillium ucsense TaxID=2839758 RepID=A0A8J8VXM8_9EURO|nr:Uncharacterized protein PECM_000631 [Penicillium ucsense]KAF7733289.1 Uncharacterized protein PECH_000900 [Penicillium ucsense]
MHVVEPDQYQISPSAVYKPRTSSLADALTFERSLGFENIVLVQPSIYGTDNACLLSALKQLGPSRGRGIVVVDPSTIHTETLGDWHALGVRGLRVNLQSVGRIIDQIEMEKILLLHAEIARPRNWVIELYVSMRTVPLIEAVAQRLGVRLCIDHFGSPDLINQIRGPKTTGLDPYSLPGFRSLIRLLRAGKTYVKLSAPYRLSQDQHMHDLKTMAREFLTIAPDRVIFATDWPHTRFDGIDISPFTESCLDLCAHDSQLAEKLFRRNTERMLDVFPE